MIRGARSAWSKTSMGNSLCIDIGATKTSMGIMQGGKLRLMRTFETPSTIQSALDLCARRAKGFPSPHSRICIALPGSVKNGVIYNLPNMGREKPFDAASFASKAFGRRVLVCNDVKCAALAEAEWGAARKSKSIACVFWAGSGIGGAILSWGKRLAGFHCAEAEFGHIKIAHGKSARICACGARGCLEAYCGGRGIEGEYARKFGTRKTAKEIFESKRPRDVSFAKEASSLFGIGLANIANALDPEIIIVGGSLSKSYLGKYRSAVLSSFRSNAKPPANRAKIAESALPHGVLMGAGLLGVHEPI